MVFIITTGLVSVLLLCHTPKCVGKEGRIGTVAHTDTVIEMSAHVPGVAKTLAQGAFASPCPPAVLRWDGENVDYWLRCLGTPLDRHTLSMTSVIAATAIANNVAVVSNVCDFARVLYYLSFTNNQHVSAASTLLGGVTNQQLVPTLIDIWTNEYGKQYIMPETGSAVIRRCLINALRRMGTPDVVEQLNHAWAGLNQRGLVLGPPGETISPDRCPQEAREWLFTHWSPTVRARMVDRWLESERPETPNVLRLYIKKLEATALDDPYWGPTNAWVRDPFGRLPASRAYEKQAWIAEIKDKTEHYARKYRRWLKDEQRMPLHYGCYRDGNWDEYRRLSEEDRRRRYGKQYGSPVFIKEIYE